MTAKEFLISKRLNGWANHTVVSDLMADFAKYHVTLALQAASKNAQANLSDEDEEEYNQLGDIVCEVYKPSILNSYPLENIK